MVTNRCKSVRLTGQEDVKTLIDTVKFDIRVNFKKFKINRIAWTNIVHRPKSEMTYYRLFDQNDASVPRIVYATKNGTDRIWLKVEVSVPRFLYGSNVYEVAPADIKLFFKKLRRYLASTLKMPLSEIPNIDQCEMEKLHLCKNFKVDSRLHDYLRVLSGIQLTGYKLLPYHAAGSHRSESVVWKRGNSTIKYYDKKAEIKQNKSYRDKAPLIKQAEGVLRFEVELAPHEMRQQSQQRLAGELLSSKFITKVLQQKLSLVGVDKTLKASGFDSMVNHIAEQPIDTRTKNSLIAFLTQIRYQGEGHCKAMYSRSAYNSNYNKIKALFSIQKIVFNDIDLPPLKLVIRNRNKKRPSLSTIEMNETAAKK